MAGDVTIRHHAAGSSDLSGTTPSTADLSVIEMERLRSVFQYAPAALGVSAGNAALTATVLSIAVGYEKPTAWAAAVATVSLLRWWVRSACLRQPGWAADAHAWAAISVLGTLATSLLWGVGTAMLCPSGEAYQVFLAFLVGGMCAGAATVNSAHFPTVAAFIGPVVLPLAVRLLFEGRLGQVSALTLTICGFSLLLVARRAHRAFGTNMQVRLALQQEQRKLAEANERLKNEIAERQSVEAILHQSQKMEAIGHLTGGLAHDFANLLHIIVGNLHLIARAGADNPRVVSFAAEAEKAALRGSELTGSLLSFARRQHLQARQVDLNILLKDFEPLLRRAAPPPIQFTTDYAADTCMCFVDPSHFQSAILNLVINARDAMPQGGILTIETRIVTVTEDELLGNPDASPGRFVSVAIHDTGCGMTDEVLARVIEPFFTTKAVGKGSGLGLSQVYGFCRQSAGDLRLSSVVGQGTSAALLLPVLTAADNNPAIQP